MTDSRISGALEPNAMSVRLETVSFQIRTVAVVVSPLGLLMVISFSWEVMTCGGGGPRKVRSPSQTRPLVADRGSDAHQSLFFFFSTPTSMEDMNRSAMMLMPRNM